MEFKLGMKFWVFDTHTKIIFKQYSTFVSYKNFLQAFQANTHKIPQKIENKFQKCVLEFNFACITEFRLLIFSKKVKIFADYCSYYGFISNLK